MTLEALYHSLPKLATIYGFVAAYREISAPNMESLYVCMVKQSSNQPFHVVHLSEWEVVSFLGQEDYHAPAVDSATSAYPEFTIHTFTAPVAFNAIDAQLRELTDHGWSGMWNQLKDSTGNLIGWVNEKIQAVCISHNDDLYRYRQNEILVDGGGFRLKGICDDYEFDTITPLRIGFVSDELVESGSYERGHDAAQDVHDWQATKHTRLSELDSVDAYDEQCSQMTAEAL